ncbi:MAG: hypothetical protein R2853_11615 [Thermomicrobiales bacterium]
MGLPYASTRERQDAAGGGADRHPWGLGAEPFTFAGRYYQATDAGVPRPVQAPAPPPVIAGGGERTLAQVARLADAANGPGPAGQASSADLVGRNWPCYAASAKAAGRPC